MRSVHRKSSQIAHDLEYNNFVKVTTSIHPSVQFVHIYVQLHNVTNNDIIVPMPHSINHYKSDRGVQLRTNICTRCDHLCKLDAYGLISSTRSSRLSTIQSYTTVYVHNGKLIHG